MVYEAPIGVLVRAADRMDIASHKAEILKILRRRGPSVVTYAFQDRLKNSAEPEPGAA